MSWMTPTKFRTTNSPPGFVISLKWAYISFAEIEEFLEQRKIALGRRTSPTIEMEELTSLKLWILHIQVLGRGAFGSRAHGVACCEGT